jgi:hypothetical protein
LTDGRHTYANSRWLQRMGAPGIDRAQQATYSPAKRDRDDHEDSRRTRVDGAPPALFL